MAKEKLQFEYVFDKVSPTVLWYSISTPIGLSDWFADIVSSSGNVFTFQWAKVQEEAELLSSKEMSSVRFRWADDVQNDVYFEMKISSNSITGDTSLTITDFAEKGEEKDLKDLWNTQIEKLKRKIGA